MIKDNVINANINVSTKSEAFETWLMLTKALHKLTPAEIKVLALFLYKRHELSFKINDPELLNEFLFNNSKTRKDIESILGFDKPTTLNNLLSSLRRKGALKDNQIQPQYIPNLSKDFNEYVLMFKVKIK
jgi:hypothetical protein